MSRKPANFLQWFSKDGSKGTFSKVSNFGKDKPHKVAIGDVVIIISYARMDFEEAKTFKPRIIFPNVETNSLV